MDWTNVKADKDMILDTHYTEGRNGRSIDKIVIHHNAGNLTVEDCYRVWESREASAHYQVQSDGRIGQLVWDTDTAWHCGDFEQNCRSIGIEHADDSSSPWHISDACLDAGAHLVAALCRYYGLGRPEWGRNLFGHSDFAPTECPGSLREGQPQHDAYVARAQAWYDAMEAGRETIENGDDMEPHNVWEYAYIDNDGKNTAPGGNMYNTAVETHDMVSGQQPHNVWEYAYINEEGKNTAPGGNMYNTVVEIYTQVSALSEAVKTLAAMQGADPDKVAQAVSDAVQKKLESLKLEVSAQ